MVFPANTPARLESVSSEAWPEASDIEVAQLSFCDDMGRRCRVYAARCFPDGRGPHPVVLHAPGGGQTISATDLRWWAERGFACVSFDWAIGLFGGHDPARKSEWPQGVLLQSEPQISVAEAILPLAIRAVGVCLDWMQSDPRCNAERIGMVGISWGGYLTLATTAYEPRLRAIVPVYGCGGLFAGSHPCLPAMPDALASLWSKAWDPAGLADQISIPVCFCSGTNDFFGRLGDAERLLSAMRADCVWNYLANANHHIAEGASRLAVAFLKQHLADANSLPPTSILHEDFSIQFSEPTVKSSLWWTPSTCPDEFACWWPGAPQPEDPVRAIFGTVQLADGVEMSTPVKRMHSEGTATVLPAIWPDALAGVDYQWGLCSTLFHRPALTRTQTSGDPTRAIWTPDPARHGVIDLVLRCPADPRWNVDLHGIEIGLACHALRDIQASAISLDEEGRRASELEIEKCGWDGSWMLRLNLPDSNAWAAVLQVSIQAVCNDATYIVGPIRRMPRDFR